jgi:2-dehydro-3-deoxy-D-arabinonate dehydratase
MQSTDHSQLPEDLLVRLIQGLNVNARSEAIQQEQKKSDPFYFNPHIMDGVHGIVLARTTQFRLQRPGAHVEVTRKIFSFHKARGPISYLWFKAQRIFVSMWLYRTHAAIVLKTPQGEWRTIPGAWDETVNRKNLHAWLTESLSQFRPGTPPRESELLPPVGSQEVWAAGVTYLRSKAARMDESKQSGASAFYDHVYGAERPELFFKASPHRVSGHGQRIRVRKDSTWSVPEPELTLFVCSEGTIEGFTVGNDVSSRSIEGENPLYLPQAKMFEGSTALGPCLYVPGTRPDKETTISMEILRGDVSAYSDSATLSRMKRSFDELSSWLFRELAFPTGVYLMTGTCLVPPDGFSLQPGDRVRITIDGIGMLENPVTA